MAAPTLDELADKAEGLNTVIASAVSLFAGLSAIIAAGKNDPVKMQALADKLDSEKTTLAEAIVANTPAAP